MLLKLLKRRKLSKKTKQKAEYFYFISIFTKNIFHEIEMKHRTFNNLNVFLKMSLDDYARCN